MKSRNTHINQHINPKTYLKHFAIDNFVHFINFDDPYRKYVQRKGIGHKIFTEKNYYDFPNEGNQAILEKMFNKIESKSYNEIINDLEDRQNLGYEIKIRLIEWIMMQKFRSSKFRDNFSNLDTWLKKTIHGLKYGKESIVNVAEKYEKEGSDVGKIIQLEMFLDQERNDEFRRSFSTNFLNRHWKILTSKNKNFITSDNPGYSVTFSPHLLRLGLPLESSFYNLSNDVNSMHFFPLTASKCLQLLPILEGDLPEINIVEMEKFILRNVEFEECTEDKVDGINLGTVNCAYKLIIGKSKEDLVKFKLEK